MSQTEITQTVTTLVAEHREAVESLAATGDNIQKALAETFLEIGAGQ